MLRLSVCPFTAAMGCLSYLDDVLTSVLYKPALFPFQGRLETSLILSNKFAYIILSSVKVITQKFIFNILQSKYGQSMETFLSALLPWEQVLYFGAGAERLLRGTQSVRPGTHFLPHRLQSGWVRLVLFLLLSNCKQENCIGERCLQRKWW